MATNKINKKSYVGFTSKSLDHRKSAHKYYAHENTSRNTLFYNAIRKHGWENFDWIILYTSNDLDFTLNIMEGYFIRIYDTYNNGYNMTFGGNGTINPTQETRNKIAIANSKRIVSDVSRKKMSESSKLQSIETRQKISNFWKGRPKTELHNKKIQRPKKPDGQGLRILLDTKYQSHLEISS